MSFGLIHKFYLLLSLVFEVDGIGCVQWIRKQLQYSCGDSEENMCHQTCLSRFLKGELLFHYCIFRVITWFSILHVFWRAECFCFCSVYWLVFVWLYLRKDWNSFMPGDLQRIVHHLNPLIWDLFYVWPPYCVVQSHTTILMFQIKFLLFWIYFLFFCNLLGWNWKYLYRMLITLMLPVMFIESLPHATELLGSLRDDTLWRIGRIHCKAFRLSVPAVA